MSARPPHYRIYDRSGGGVTHDIHAATLEDAIRQGREWIEDGDWSSTDAHGEPVYRTVELPCEVGPIIYRPLSPEDHLRVGIVVQYYWEWSDGAWRTFIATADLTEDSRALCDAIGGQHATVSIDATPDAEGCTRVTVHCRESWPTEIDEEATRAADREDCSGEYSDPEPDCEAEGGEHEWMSTSELGDELSSRSHGGTSMTHSSVCARCGEYRDETDEGAQHHETLRSVRITPRDSRSEAWLRDRHAVEGWLPSWLCELLECPPTTRMTADEAREWVLDQQEDDTHDPDDLEHAFAALIGRRPDDDEDQWSLLCAEVAS